MLTPEAIQAQIATLEAERMQHFANWQRVEGALITWRQVLVELATADPNHNDPSTIPVDPAGNPTQAT